jgi:hypothetical protein
MWKKGWWLDDGIKSGQLERRTYIGCLDAGFYGACLGQETYLHGFKPMRGK